LIFIVSDNGPIYIETDTLPDLTGASLYPKALSADGNALDFLRGRIALSSWTARSQRRSNSNKEDAASAMRENAPKVKRHIRQLN
jgi:hypothetical protein